MDKKSQLLWDTIDSVLAKARWRDMDIIVHAIEIEDVLLIINRDSRKVAIVGVKQDNETKQYKIESMMIDLKKWRWAELEGFSFDEIMEDERLGLEIFRLVDVEDISVFK